MGDKPWAWVEEMGIVSSEAGRHMMFKLIAADMILDTGFSREELQEMADRLNAAVQARVEEAMKSHGLVEGAELPRVVKLKADYETYISDLKADKAKAVKEAVAKERRRVIEMVPSLFGPHSLCASAELWAAVKDEREKEVARAYEDAAMTAESCGLNVGTETARDLWIVRKVRDEIARALRSRSTSSETGKGE